MNKLNIFLSVGGTATEQQEAFVGAVEDRLRSESLIPCTVGRNTFSSDAPLRAIVELMDKCAGTVVIALERTYFPAGVEKRGGPKEAALNDIKLPTPWNQIEAAMAHSRGHPLLVIVESGIKSEGLLERGYDWYVQWVKLEAAALNSMEFNGVLASWKQKVVESHKKPAKAKPRRQTVRRKQNDQCTSDCPRLSWRALERDDFSSNRHPAPGLCWSMIFSENRFPLFGIML